ncbi:MAG TPA: cob(I)yrinic acid a,c-diamide adenosyltransferase [Spirochaetia bacterium]|nr:cob(I)yrinic acid a,c-diamide adenosyltransferase [Spirochaetia bacterium]
MSAEQHQGMVQVYTGNGKGKTTAVLGLALRSAGHGKRVFMLQFMKGSPDYGEVRAAALLPGFTLVQSGLPTFVDKANPSPEDLRLAAAGLARARQEITGGGWDLVILDEINVALDYGLLRVEDVEELIASRPAEMELVLTGRYANDRIIALADLVSEVKLVKHPYYRGVEAREGIEY